MQTGHRIKVVTTCRRTLQVLSTFNGNCLLPFANLVQEVVYCLLGSIDVLVNTIDSMLDI